METLFFCSLVVMYVSNIGFAWKQVVDMAHGNSDFETELGIATILQWCWIAVLVVGIISVGFWASLGYYFLVKALEVATGVVAGFVLGFYNAVFKG